MRSASQTDPLRSVAGRSRFGNCKNPYSGAVRVIDAKALNCEFIFQLCCAVACSRSKCVALVAAVYGAVRDSEAFMF